MFPFIGAALEASAVFGSDPGSSPGSFWFLLGGNSAFLCC